MISVIINIKIRQRRQTWGSHVIGMANDYFFLKEIFDPITEEIRNSCGQSIPNSGKSNCKCPGAGSCLELKKNT